jgi:hypothetical protein
MRKLEAIKRALLCWEGRTEFNAFEDRGIISIDRKLSRLIVHTAAAPWSTYFFTSRCLNETRLSFSCMFKIDRGRALLASDCVVIVWDERSSRIKCTRDFQQLHPNLLSKTLAGELPTIHAETVELSLGTDELVRFVLETNEVFESQAQQAIAHFEQRETPAFGPATAWYSMRFACNSVYAWLKANPAVAPSRLSDTSIVLSVNCLLSGISSQVSCATSCSPWSSVECVFQIQTESLLDLAFVSWDINVIKVYRYDVSRKPAILTDTRSLRSLSEPEYSAFSTTAAFLACVQLFEETVAILADPLQPLRQSLSCTLLPLLRGFDAE